MWLHARRPTLTNRVVCTEITTPLVTQYKKNSSSDHVKPFIPASLLLPYQSCDSLPLIFIIIRGSQLVKARKLTLENSITSQYEEINLSILRQLQAGLHEDPLQDLT